MNQFDSSPTVHVATSSLFDRWVAFFLPSYMLRDSDTRRCGRMFIASHTFGPFAGFAILSWLYALDPHPGMHLWIPLVCVVGFWAFLPALRLNGSFALLAVLSVQNLAFIVLFISYHFGGISSPFLPWIVVTPLLAFFYLGDVPRLTWITIGGLTLDLGLFLLAYHFADSPPQHVPLQQMTSLGVMSLFSAGLYATAMAAYYARVIASRSELEAEVKRHLGTARALSEAKDTAESASRAKTDFLASMSHELRTPLNAVIGFSEIMACEAFGPLGHERYRGYSKDIRDSGSHLLDIINDILDVAKAESGTFELFEETFDCREAITDAAKMLRKRISDAGLTLELQIPDKLPRLRADRRRTKQVFLNLIHNAVKFTPSGGKVCISAACDRDGLSVTVRDTGIGIAKENLKKVLQPFVQVGATPAHSQEGTGLGLPLVQVMMQRHGGYFELDSEAGKSTTARIVFPASRIVAPADEPSHDDRAHADVIATVTPLGADRAPLVLVVDDDESLRSLVTRILARAGYRTLTAVHGLDALKQFHTEAIDLVVTDMLMPEMDGAELLRALRVERPSLPVVAMSGVEEWKEWLRIAEHLGACATMHKPIAAPELLDAVRNALTGVLVEAAA